MATPFHLQIVTPDGSEFDGQAVRIIVRTIAGDVCVMARHTNYCTALGMGEAKVTMEDGSVRTAACMGGMLNVMDGKVRVIATTWEWKDLRLILPAPRRRKRQRKSVSQRRISSVTRRSRWRKPSSRERWSARTSQAADSKIRRRYKAQGHAGSQ